MLVPNSQKSQLTYHKVRNIPFSSPYREIIPDSQNNYLKRTQTFDYLIINKETQNVQKESRNFNDVASEYFITVNDSQLDSKDQNISEQILNHNINVQNDNLSPSSPNPLKPKFAVNSLKAEIQQQQ